ncbi:MAG: ribosome assembly factor SBDS [Candidatus Woesearchaeota archaeon]
MAGTQNFSKKPSPERLHLNFARMKKNGITFEVVIDPDAAIAFKHGMGDDWKEVVRAERVFANAQKGLFSPEHDWKSLFPDMTEDEVIEYIIRNGELQLSSEYRKKLQEFKKNKIIEIIHRNAINPENNLPHPITRLKNAFDEANVRIDDKKSAEDQLQEILKKLKPVLPIKFETKKLQIHIGVKYARQQSNLIRSYAKIMKEEWLSDGCYFATVEVPSGVAPDLIDELNKRTHGGVEITVLEN